MLILVGLQNGGLNQLMFYLCFYSSIWMIIIRVTYFDESGDPPIATSANGDILPIRVGVHSVYIPQSTL